MINLTYRNEFFLPPLQILLIIVIILSHRKCLEFVLQNPSQTCLDIKGNGHTFAFIMHLHFPFWRANTASFVPLGIFLVTLWVFSDSLLSFPSLGQDFSGFRVFLNLLEEKLNDVSDGLPMNSASVSHQFLKMWGVINGQLFWYQAWFFPPPFRKDPSYPFNQFRPEKFSFLSWTYTRFSWKKLFICSIIRSLWMRIMGEF